MLFIVLSGILLALALIPLGRYFRSQWSRSLSVLPLFLVTWFISKIPSIAEGNVLYQQFDWAPSLGLNLSFRLDGLSLLFSLLITLIGTLIFIYTSSYLKDHPHLDRFYGYLSLFMASMLGLVMSDNILLLFVFWELTSISSFFLIGFNNTEAGSRKSAIKALCITGLGGFFLLVGLVIMGRIADTYLIHELLASGDIIKNHSTYPLILGLLFMGALTKSAQFPFHFWLPDAMKAPTPVSAYLHSATMVKAGIFLLLRFTPVLGDTPYWSWTLMIVGGLTMVFAGILALLRTDLKALLAYSTISVLGILTFLIGLGTREALIAACVFIVVHALYKATLFLTTGIIDHETGTRQLEVLSGLRNVMFPVFIAGLLAALSSAGVPLFFGFIGKDLIYEATLHASENIAMYLTIFAVLTNICLVAAGFMAGLRPFVGKLPTQFEHVHLPHGTMWIPPLILATLGLIFGVLPTIIGNNIISPAISSLSIQGGQVELKIWHGFNLVLILSLLTLFTGTVVYFFSSHFVQYAIRSSKRRIYSAQSLFEDLWKIFKRISAGFTGFMHNGFLRSYVAKIIIFAEILLLFEIFLAGPLYIDYDELTPISIYEAMNVILLIGALFLIVKTSSRLTAVVGMSIVGFTICLIYVFYGAPDLAMTQFTIDTLTVVLFAFVLFNLPSFLRFPTKNQKVIVRDAVISLLFGTILSLIAINVLQIPTTKEVSEFYGEFAYTLARGKNVVNVILVDFRGFDTMFEIVVLGISALGVYSLMKLRLKPTERE